MIERERGEQDPAEETVRLTRLLNESETKRARFQHLYAEGVIEIEDLRARLSELEAIYSEAQRRRDDLDARRKHLTSPAKALRNSSLKTGTDFIGASILR
jgi:hypothetical protein